MAKWVSPKATLPTGDLAADSWNANLIKIERKNWLIFVHHPTAYSLLYPEIKKAELQNFEGWFFSRLRGQLLYEGIGPELSFRYPSAQATFFKSNNNKRIIGIMNHFVSDLKYCIPYWGGLDEIGVPEINRRLNDTPVGSPRLTLPVREMEEFLKTIP